MADARCVAPQKKKYSTGPARECQLEEPHNLAGSVSNLFLDNQHFRRTMDAAELLPLIDQLEVQIDDLRDVLEPLLSTALSHHATQLPLLDKAKLYVLATYAIESLLFCTYGSPDTTHIQT